jgi:hypothetical protein
VALWSSGGPDPRDSQLTPQPYLPVTQCLPHRSKQLFLPPGSPNLTLIQMVSKMGKENKLRKISVGMLPSGSSVVFKNRHTSSGMDQIAPCPCLLRSAPINARGTMDPFSSNRSAFSSNTGKISLSRRGNVSGLSVAFCLPKSQFPTSMAGAKTMAKFSFTWSLLEALH